MAALTISYSVGDTVYVRYAFPDSEYFAPATRVVSKIEVTASGDVATVSFTSGNTVIDSDATTRVYTTAALCATAIVDDVISRVDAAVVLEGGATNSIASTASQPALSLGRVDT